MSDKPVKAWQVEGPGRDYDSTLFPFTDEGYAETADYAEEWLVEKIDGISMVGDSVTIKVSIVMVDPEDLEACQA